MGLGGATPGPDPREETLPADGRLEEEMTEAVGGKRLERIRAKWACGSLLLLSFLGGLVLWCNPAAPDPDQRPNVLVVLIDALRADHLGCYGHSRDTSPIIDSLSRESVLFETAMSPASWTKPSIPSLFTGLYPIQHGVFTGNTQDSADRITSDVLRDEHITLAEALREAGYATGAFVENVQISSFMGFDQGFDVYAEDLGDAQSISNRFIKWLDSGIEGPFFGYVHYLDPHWPYVPPAPFDTMFSPPAQTSVDFNNVNWKYLERQIQSGDVKLSPDDLEAMRSLYDGEIRYTDTALAGILEALRERGLYENTIFVLTADHGEEFMEHGRIGHGNTLYDEVLHIPLIIRAPRGRVPEGPPGTIADPVSLIDIMPTVLDLAGIEIPGDIAGRSLRPLMEGRSMEPVPIFGDHRPDGPTGRIFQSIRLGKHKLIREFTLEGGAQARDEWNPPPIRPGDWLEIEGVLKEDGLFLALEIEPYEASEEIRIAGRVEDLRNDGSAFRILGLPCLLRPDFKIKDSSGETLKGVELTTGLWVQAKGSWKDDLFLVRRVKLLDDPDDQKQEIKAPVLAVEWEDDDEVEIRLAMIDVEGDDETEFEGDWPDWTPPDHQSQQAPADLPDETGKRVLARVSLYDLLSDPLETEDLSTSEPEILRDLLDRLDAWEERYAQQVGEEERVILDEATLERLRSLGYIR
jgi:arylsulfatase A-like enzyme